MRDTKTVKGMILGAAIAIPASVLLTAAAMAQNGQPRMQAAYRALETARSELRMAAANKGGHRVRALGLVESAMREVQLGISAGS